MTIRGKPAFRKERRRRIRRYLAMPAGIKSSFKHGIAELCDLSELGCRLDNVDIALELGNRILIKPPKSESFLGTVKWVSKGQAGIEFDEALQSASVENFCRMYPDSKSDVQLDVAA